MQQSHLVHAHTRRKYAPSAIQGLMQKCQHLRGTEVCTSPVLNKSSALLSGIKDWVQGF